MTKTQFTLLPNLQRILAHFGERIRSARLRRNLTTAMIAERAEISLPTLRQIEQGSPTVSLGAYAQVLLALNLEKDLALLARDDDMGHRLQDLNLPVRVRPKRRKISTQGEKK